MKNKYKILHLEDVPTDAELAARELRKSSINFEHFVVDSEKDYRQALNTYAPDIILCDHSLAAFNSIEALKIFKEKKINVPFILITATLSDEVAINILKDGADDYILKDRLKRLPSAVTNAIERFQLERERKQLLYETEEREALSKKKLSDLSDKLLLATKAAGIGIWDYSFENNLFIADEALLTHYDLTPAEFKGNYLELMNYVHKEDRPRVLQDFRNALINFTDVNTEFRIKWQNGSTHFIKAAVLVQRDETGNPVRLIGTHQDVTTDKKSEQVLRESEFRLVEAQSVAKIGSWETDLLNFKVMWSLETYRIFEIPYKDSNVTHQNFLELVHPNDKVKVDAAFIASLSTQKVNTIEHQIITPSGIIKTVEERWHIFKDNKGKPLCARGTIQDITERKQSEQLIIESEAKYRSFFESSMDGILLTSTDGEIISANPAACEIFKMTEAEICATGRLGLADIADPRLQPLVQERQRTGKVKGELTLVRKDGSKFPGELTSAVFKDAHGQERTSMIIRDITDRKEAEERNIFQAKLLNTIGQAAISTDISGNINYWNKAAEQMYGWSAEEVMGKKIDLLVPAQQSKQQVDEIMEQLAQGNSWSGEFEVQRKDATIFPVFVTNSPIYDQYNQLAGIIGISIDITERKKAEQAINESETFNRGVLDSMSSHLAVIDASGTIIKVNQSWNTFAINNGSHTLEKCGVGANYFNVCTSSTNGNDDVPDRALDGIKQVLNGTLTEFYLEYPCHSPSEERWFYLRVKKIESNEPLALIEHQYITERKKAEEKVITTSNALQQSLNDLNNIMDSSLDIICTIDEEGRFVKVSAASESILGYKPGELKGRQFMDFVFYEDVEITIAAAAQVMSGVPVTIFENRYVHKNGNPVQMLWSARWNDNDKLMYCIAKDASEKKRLEKAFINERQQFHDLFMQAPTSMGILKGPNHVFEVANPLYLQLIGKENIIGKSVKEVLPEVESQGFIAVLDSVYKTGETFVANEMPIKIDKDGTEKTVELYLNFIYQVYKNFEGIIEGIIFFAVDVTEQVLSRKKIEQSERFFKGVIENSDDMITIVEPSGKTLYASPAVSRKFGYTNEECLSLNMADIVHPDDVLIVQEFMMKLMATPGVPLECPLIRDQKKDGTYMWVEGTLTNLMEIEGINALVANFRDVTERKDAETKIEESEKRFRQIVETAQEGIWMIDENNITTFVNDKMCEILGYTREEMMGTSNLSFKDEEEQKKAREQIERRKKGIKETHESRYITKSGRHIWANVSTNPLWNSKGEYKGALAMITDITNRKTIEKQLAQSESSLKRAQALADLGNWEIDLADNKQIWSDELYRILGLNEDVTPSTELYLSLIHPDDIEKVEEKILQSAKSLTGTSFGYRLIKKDNSVKYCYTESRYEFDQNNNPVRLYGVVQDITKSKLAEIERTKMIADIIQRNKELEQFTYIVSHNLRAPVANIKSFAEALGDKSYPENLQQEFLSHLSLSVSKLDDVTRDLNDVLLVKQKVNDVKEDIHLSTLVNNIQISIQNIIEQYAVTIVTDFSEVETILSIRSFMHSILYNLISNSIKYRSPDKAPVISIRTHKTLERVELIFSDNGLGIDMKKNRDNVFGLYKRFHLHIEGKGVGLFMTKSQIETLGGTIEVSSEINRGTAFKIYLPLSTTQL